MPNRDNSQTRAKKTALSSGISRRAFMASGAAVGAAAVGITAAPQRAAAQSGPMLSTGSGFAPIEINGPMARWKAPQSLEFVQGATERFNFPNWQSGNDDSVYYNLNISAFIPTRVVPPDDQFSVLERDIQTDLLNLTFTDHEGNTTPTLAEYLVGPRQVQAMVMAHQGKIVFEVYPGMNPLDTHIWMSASKTCTGLLMTMLADEGTIDLDQPMSSYVEELQGSAWDNITVKNTMNMATALNNEETFANLVDPDTWIAEYFGALFGVGDIPPTKNREMMKTVQPLGSEAPGELFRYSTANTQALVMVTEAVTQMPWQDLWHQRVWSKIGARSPFMIGLTPDGLPIGGGAIITTAEDMIRYAMLYTPSWNTVSTEEVIPQRMLDLIFNMGDPAAYTESTEREYGHQWFGEVPFKNTAQWDHAFEDGAMFKHGNMGQGIYVDPQRDFCGMTFAIASNDTSVAGIDHSPGYLRAAAKAIAGG